MYQFPTDQSPWGVPQHFEVKAPGIVFVSTTSHGGFILDQAKQNAVARMFPSFQPFAGAPYYEEDCDWAIVALVFPTVFKAADVRLAVRTAISLGSRTDRPASGKNQNWASVWHWLSTTHQGEALRAQCHQQQELEVETDELFLVQ